MNSMMEMIFVLMFVVGVAMIVYDVINSAKTADPLSSVRKNEGFAKVALKR